MSVIGPRPALWNQDVLIAEREKYHANDVKPGLTGWAQINGRDELEIPVKAKLDGEYVEKESLLFDIKCFLGTIGSVLSSDGVVEGGTGELTKAGVEDERDISPEKAAQQIKAGAKVMGALSAAMLGIAGIVSWIFLRKDTTKSDKKKHTVVKRWVLLGTIFESIAIVFVNIKGWNGVKIVRIPLTARGNNSIGLACNYLSFVISGYIWKCLTEIKADYVFTFEVSPMTQALIGVWYAKKHKIPHYVLV